MNIVLAVLWIFGGVVWLRRAAREEANPSTPISLFAQPERQTDKDRKSKKRLAMLNLTLGCLYILSAIYSHTH
jgi:hypothetical protein